MRPVLWVQDLQAAGEAGLPHGAGLAGLGLDPRRLLVVGVRGAVAALAAAEMGLEEAGLAGVLVDLPARLPADMLKLGKRLSLRAERQRTPCFLMHAGTAAVDAPVASRWTVASRPVLQGGALQGTAACPDMTTVFDVALTKNRFGALGRWSMAWRPEIGVSGISADIAQPGQFHASHQVSHQSGPTVQRFTFEAVTAPAVGRVAADSRLGSPGTAGWRRAA